MFPLWFTIFGGFVVFLDLGPSILFLVFPLFLGCFGLFKIGRVLSLKTNELFKKHNAYKGEHFTSLTLFKKLLFSYDTQLIPIGYHRKFWGETNG
jgi:hypothetical protein